MSNRYKIKHQSALYYLTLTVKGWVDFFSRQRYCDIILDSFRYCKEHKGFHVYGYVIMTNHIHLIASASGEQGLSDVIGDFKSFTAKAILKSISVDPEGRREWLLYLFKYFANKNKQQRKINFRICPVTL